MLTRRDGDDFKRIRGVAEAASPPTRIDSFHKIFETPYGQSSSQGESPEYCGVSDNLNVVNN